MRSPAQILPRSSFGCEAQQEHREPQAHIVGMGVAMTPRAVAIA
jgi:hypothetical protein